MADNLKLKTSLDDNDNLTSITFKQEWLNYNNSSLIFFFS
jgi:hypothetical protein